MNGEEFSGCNEGCLESELSPFTGPRVDVGRRDITNMSGEIVFDYEAEFVQFGVDSFTTECGNLPCMCAIVIRDNGQVEVVRANMIKFKEGELCGNKDTDN